MEIVGSQVRAARAFLQWTLKDLADAAKVNESTVRAIENSNPESQHEDGVASTRAWRAAARAESLAKIVKTLEEAGITFLPATAVGPGVRCRPKI